MAIRSKKDKLKTASWVSSILKSLLNSGRATRRHSRGAKSSARLLVTQLEDRLTPTTLHWLGSAAANGDLWSVASNWLEGQAPVSGDILVFDSAAPGFSATANGFAPTNDLSGLTNLAIEINNSSSTYDFTISGDSFGLITTNGVGITCTLTAGTGASPTETIDNNITLGANTTVDVGFGSLTLGGVIGGVYSLTAAGSPTSTLTLNAANTYSGGTVLTSGTLAVNTDTSLGTGILTLNGGTLSNTSTSPQIPNNFVVAAPSTIGGSSFTLDGNGTLNATLTLDAWAFFNLDGALSGPGGLTEAGFPGETTLGGTTPNTFTGGVYINWGAINLDKTPGVNAVVSPITLVDGFQSSLSLGASDQINGNATVNVGDGTTFSMNGYSDSVASLTGLGGVAIGSAGSGLTVTGGGSQLLTGGISGSGYLAYDGTGSLTLAGDSSGYTGTLKALAGTLIVDADFSDATAAVAGGTLGGTGVVGSIDATSGAVNPATAGTGGTLNTASNSSASVSSLNGATFTADLAAQGASNELALGADATLDLNGANLALDAIGSTLADTYQIITSPTGGLSGSFNSLPNGSTISVGSQTFQINYSSSAVTLTNLASGSTTLHWTGAISSNWSVAGNWEENSVPVSGDTLVFDTSTPGFAATAAAFAPDNDLYGLTNIALVINDNSSGNNFVIAGNGLGLVTTAGVGIASTLAAGTTAAINTPLALAGNTSVDVGLGSLTLGGAISGSSSLNVAGSQEGTLTLNVANTYSGGTVITSGTVEVNTDTSLGTGTITLDGGTLEAAGYLTMANSIVVSTPSTISGGFDFTLDGNVVLNANLNLGSMDLNGAISGTGGLIQSDFSGTTTLSGTTPNTFTGGVTDISGGVTLDKTPGVNAVVSPINLVRTYASLNLGADDQINGNAAVYLGPGASFSTVFYKDTVASLSGPGDVSLTFANTGLTVTGGGSQALTGDVSGSGFLNYDGTGTLMLGGTSSFSGQLDAQAGTVLVDADFSSATATATGSGIIGGTGIVGVLPSTGNGTLNPGGSGVGGILTTAANSDNSALSGETFQVDLAANAVSSELVIGDSATIDLTNSSLSVNILDSTYGTVYTIIASPTGGISGAFVGLPNDSTFAADGHLFRINYTTTAVTLTDLQAVSLPSSLPVGEAGVAYDQTITSTGGTAPVTLAVTNTENPDGLTISVNETTDTVSVTGVPTSSGTVAFTVTPTDANGPEAGTNYTIVVNSPVVLTPASLPEGDVGTAYNQSITFTGGTAPVTLAVSNETDSTGLIISGSGTGAISISGTPTSAGTVTFTVTPTDAIGTGKSKVYSIIVVFPAPGVTGITPASGSVLGGTTVTIAGSELSYDPAVTFGGVAATIDSDTDSQIVVTTPSGSPGNQTVDVATSGGTATGSFTYIAVPAVTGVSPTYGPIAGGSRVTITGTALANATQVLFGSDPGTVLSDAATQIIVSAPAENAGSVDITVTSLGGTSPTTTADQFLFVPPTSPATSTVSVSADGTVAAGSSITVTLQAEDANGNDLTTGGQTVTFGLGSTSGVQGTFSSVTDNGNGTYSATFSGTLVGVNTITATINGQTVTSGSPSITVTPGPVSLAKSVVLVTTGSVTAGGGDTITLQAEDDYGNDLTTGGLTVVFELGTGQGTFGPVTDNGNGTYSATFSDTTAGNNTITATIDGQPLTSTAPSVTIVPGTIDPANSVVTVSSASVAAGSGVTVTLQTRDEYGNDLISGGASVDFGLGSGAGQGTFGLPTDNGNGTYTATFSGTTGGSNTVTATVNNQTVTTRAPSIEVTPGSASAAYSIISIATETDASGIGDTVTLQAVDAYGNDLASGGATVKFGLGTGAGLGTFGTVTDNQNGTYTATFTGGAAGDNTITATIDGQSVTTTLPSITVTSGVIDPAKCLVTVSSNDLASGSGITVTLQARDASGNDLTTGGASVAFALGSGTEQGTFGLVTDNENGTYTATFTGSIEGTNTITATANKEAVTTTPPSVTVTPGTIAAAISVVTLSSSTVAAGSTVTATLQARDAAGNALTTGGASIVFELGSTSGGNGKFDTVIDNGSGTYTAVFTGGAAGANTITATVNGLTIGTRPAAIAMTAGPVDPANCTASLAAANDQSGSPDTITVRLEDAYNNPITSGTTFGLSFGSTSGGYGSFGAITNNHDGTYSFPFTGSNAGTNSIFVTIAGKSLTPLPITVTPGPVSLSNSTVGLSTQTIQLGGAATITLQAVDSNGNPLTTGGLAVIFSLDGPGTLSPVTDNGNGTYTALVTGTADGTITVNADIGGSPAQASSTLAVIGTAASGTKSKVSLSSKTVTAGGTTTVTLQAENAKGQDEVAGGLSVVFELKSAKGGKGTFTPAVDEGDGLYTATFTGTTAGSNTITASIAGVKGSPKVAAIDVKAGVAVDADAVVTLSSSAVKTGKKVTVTVHPEDAYGNKVKQSGLDVVLGLGDGTGQGTFGTVKYNNSTGTYTAAFTGTTAGSNTIVATVDGQVVVTTAPTIEVAAGKANEADSSLTPSVAVGGAIDIMLQSDKDNDQTAGG